MFWPCCSLFSFKALLYFRHLCYFSWDHVFQGAFSFHSALFHSWLFYFIQGALLFLHSAFLFLHSALFRFSVWVSTCISSPIVSQRAILLFSKLSCSYYFNFWVWSAYLLISEWDFWYFVCILLGAHELWARRTIGKSVFFSKVIKLLPDIRGLFWLKEPWSRRFRQPCRSSRIHWKL